MLPFLLCVGDAFILQEKTRKDLINFNSAARVVI